MKKYLKTLDLVENTIMVVCLAVMLLITFINVVVRKFTTTSFAFTEEVVTPTFILLTLVGAGALARKGGHIGLSALTDLFPKNFKRYMALFTAVVSLFFSVLLVYYGYKMVLGELRQGMMTPALQWPEWIFGSFVPIGGAFMVIEFINYAVLAFMKGADETPAQPAGDNKDAKGDEA